MKRSGQSTICWWIWDETISERSAEFGSVKVEKYTFYGAVFPCHAYWLHRWQDTPGKTMLLDAVDSYPAGRNPFRRTKDPGLSDYQRTGGQLNGVFMAAPLDTLILPEIWTPASPSGWHIRKMEKFSCGSGAGIVADSVPEKSMKSVSTRQKP